MPTRSDLGAKVEHKGLFKAGYPPDVLWTLPDKKRKLDASMVFSPEDGIVAVARGMKPGGFKKAEDKAIVQGGLAVLQAAGLPLPAKRDVESVRRAVSKYGPGLKKAAWGTRGVLLLGSTGMKVSTSVHALVPTIAVWFGPIGGLIAAFAGGHIAITQGIARKVLAQQEAYVKEGLAAYQERRVSATPVVAPSTPPPFPWYAAAGAVIIVGTALVLRRST